MLFLRLPIIGIRAVLAQVMLIKKLLLHSVCTKGERFGVKCHKSKLLQYHTVVNSGMGILSPGERTMTVYKNSGNVVGGEVVKCFDDHISSFFFVLSGDFFGCHFAGAWNFAIEVIGVSGAVGRDTATCMRHEVAQREWV